MKTSVVRAARVLATCAVIAVVTTDVLPPWCAILLTYVAGLLCACRFFLTTRQPPSKDRYRRLLESGGLSLFLFSLGTIALAAILLGGTNPTVVTARIIGVAILALAISTAAYIVWAYLAIQQYGRFRPRHPDFEEDEAGNLIPGGRQN